MFYPVINATVTLYDQQKQGSKSRYVLQKLWSINHRPAQAPVKIITEKRQRLLKGVDDG